VSIPRYEDLEYLLTFRRYVREVGTVSRGAVPSWIVSYVLQLGTSAYQEDDSRQDLYMPQTCGTFSKICIGGSTPSNIDSYESSMR
jgi:hypothetical protein